VAERKLYNKNNSCNYYNLTRIFTVAECVCLSPNGNILYYVYCDHIFIMHFNILYTVYNNLVNLLRKEKKRIVPAISHIQLSETLNPDPAATSDLPGNFYTSQNCLTKSKQYVDYLKV
jgi:hypothetical protein